MNYKKFLAASSVALLGLALFTGVKTKVNSQVSAATKQETSSYSLVTKVAGNKNYGIYKKVVNGKPSGKVANAIDFRYNHIQSNQKITYGKTNYWLIYVDGRRVGWVNQNFFARNKISVAKTVSLVNNPIFDYDPKDAISYATDSTGTVVDNELVKTSKDLINSGTPGTIKVKYKYGSAKAESSVTVRSNPNEGVTDASKVQPKPGANNMSSWKTHYGASLNYVGPRDFIPEKRTHSFKSGNLSLTTRLFQPIYLSVQTDTDLDGNINRVGHIPEGVTVSNGWAYTSLLSHTDLINGHIVGYNLNKLKNPYDPQYLLTMSQSKFNSYVKNIKVSPYIPVGHGQALGSSDKYVYILMNDNDMLRTAASEQIIQLNKKDLTINKIWSVKCWNQSKESPRYFKNGVVVNDHQMYALYYDNVNKKYEYWKFDRSGDSWNPTIVGATNGSFVGNGAPVQGFTYDSQNNNFYLAFNDLIFKLATDGTIKETYEIKTGREIEGISVSGNRLYTNLAQRAELLESNPLN